MIKYLRAAWDVFVEIQDMRARAIIKRGHYWY